VQSALFIQFVFEIAYAELLALRVTGLVQLSIYQKGTVFDHSTLLLCHGQVDFAALLVVYLIETRKQQVVQFHKNFITSLQVVTLEKQILNFFISPAK